MLASWYAEPLVERVGRLYGEPFHRPSSPVSFRARTYLIYLGLRVYTTFDYSWLFAPGQLGIVEPAAMVGIDLDTGPLVRDAVALGFNPSSGATPPVVPLALLDDPELLARLAASFAARAAGADPTLSTGSCPCCARP